MKIKPGVRVFGLRPELLLAVIAAETIYTQHGAEAIITSVIDGKHSKGSLHYSGCAIDLRINNLQESAIHVVHQKLIEALGVDFDVILELDKQHFHVELQPKEGYTA